MSDAEPQTTEETTDDQTAAPDLTTEAGGFSCIAEVQVLEAFFETLGTILDETKLHIDTDKLYAIGVDPANVATVEVSLPKSAFEHYSSTGGVIGLDINRMLDVLSLGESGDVIQMQLDQETRKLHIDMEGLEYTLAMIDPDTIRAEPKIPDLELPAMIELEGRQLARSITAADMVSNHIAFSVDENEESFNIQASGDTDDVDLELDRDDLLDLDVGPGESMFSLDYLKDYQKAIPTKTAVSIDLGVEMPVQLTYDHIEYNDETHGEVLMLLAPRIQSD